MNGRFRVILGVVVTLAILAGAAGIGVYAYNAGVAQGLVESGKLAAPGAGVAPYPFYGGPFFWHRPFGFGFEFLGCLFPLLFFLLFFGLLRGLTGGWRRHWGWGPGGHHGPWGREGYDGPWGKCAPPMFEEWHRQAHGQSAPTEPQPSEK